MLTALYAMWHHARLCAQVMTSRATGSLRGTVELGQAWPAYCPTGILTASFHSRTTTHLLPSCSLQGPLREVVVSLQCCEKVYSPFFEYLSHLWWFRSIHPLTSLLVWILSQLSWGEKQGGQVASLTHRDRPFALTFTPTDNWESPINLTYMSLDGGST